MVLEECLFLMCCIIMILYEHVCMHVCMTVAVDCGTLPNPSNGFVNLITTTLGSPASYSCDLGFQLRGVEVRICVETGVWSDQAPICEGEFNTIESSPGRG